MIALTVNLIMVCNKILLKVNQILFYIFYGYYIISFIDPYMVQYKHSQYKKIK